MRYLSFFKFTKQRKFNQKKVKTDFDQITDDFFHKYAEIIVANQFFIW